jgi:hypothetical protein
MLPTGAIAEAISVAESGAIATTISPFDALTRAESVVAGANATAFSVAESVAKTIICRFDIDEFFQGHALASLFV